MDNTTLRSKTCLHSALGALLIMLSSANMAISAPQDGNVAAGNATIHYHDTNTIINQQTNKAVIDWRSFDIGANEHTQFNQPTSQSITLNRVNSANPSHIMGSLSANGNIVLINPNGVMFGEHSRVDVNGLIATTADIDNDAFMQSNSTLHFNKTGNQNAAIINHGTITAKDAGLVGLVAPHVENTGIIQAKLGNIALASGDAATVDMYGDGLIGVTVSDTVSSQLATNSGTMRADGGTILMTAAQGRTLVNNLIQADGEILAPSVSQQGGTIIISGADSDVTVGGHINASGAYKAGNILIGGDYKGGGTTPSARNTTIAPSANISANSTLHGNGGKVITWADNATNISGNITATPGAHSGDGGFVETSGKNTLSVSSSASVDTGGGTWLLDPRNVTIGNNPGDVDDGTLEAALNGNNDVVIHTSGAAADAGHISIEENVDYNSSATLTFLAHGNITAIQRVSNTGNGDINLVAGWNGTTESGNITADANDNGNLEDRTTINMSNILDDNNNAYGNSYDGGANFGSIFINNSGSGEDVMVGSKFGTTTVAGYDMTLRASDGATERYAQIGVETDRVGAGATGDINVQLQNDLLIRAGDQEGSYARIGHGDSISGFGLPVGNNGHTGNIIVNAKNNISLITDVGRDANAQIGHGSDDQAGNFSGDVDVTAGGTLTLSTGAGREANVHIGHGGDQMGDSTMSGDIDVTARGDIIIRSGTSADVFADAYALIGHGGDSVDGNHNGNINVESTAGSISLTARSARSGSATIGHGGADSNNGDFVGDITVTSNNGITLQSGTNDRAVSQIGHGSGDAAGNHTGNILVTNNAGDISLTAGSGGGKIDIFSKIGHGQGAAGNHSGTITVNNAGNLTLNGGPTSTESFAQIGHGGIDADGTNSGNIIVNNTGAITLNGGGDDDNYSQIGHGGSDSDGAYTGNITINASNITSTGGSAVYTAAQIGHSGKRHDGDITGDISVISDTAITLQGGTNAHAHANIGHGSAPTGVGDYTGDITVTANSGALSLLSNNTSFTRIGHGKKVQAGVTHDGDITVSVTGDITMTAHNSQEAYVQIGHGTTDADGTFTGNINVTATGDIRLTGAANPESYAIIGHGAYDDGDNSTTGLREGHILVDSGGEISLVDGGNPSRIGHYSLDGVGAVSNSNLRIIAAALDFNAADTNSFTINDAEFLAQLADARTVGNVVIGRKGAPLNWSIDAALADAPGGNTLSLLSGRGLDISNAITNTGAATTNLVAGWDGSTGLNNDGTINMATIGTSGISVNSSITSGANIVTTDTLNLEAGNTITAALNATNVAIGTNSTGVTLSGLVGGGANQAAADSITGGPGNNADYTFENFIIRFLEIPATPSTPAVTVPPHTPDVIAPDTPVVEDATNSPVSPTPTAPAQATFSMEQRDIVNSLTLQSIEQNITPASRSDSNIILISGTEETVMDNIIISKDGIRPPYVIIGPLVTMHPVLADMFDMQGNQLF